MKKSDNKILNHMIEQFRDMVPIKDEVMEYMESGEIGKNIENIQTEIGRLLEGEASMEWYRMVNSACQKKYGNMWVYEIVNAFQKGVDSDVVRETMEEVQDVRRFQEQIEERQVIQANIESNNRKEEEQNGIVTADKQEDFAGNTMEIVEGYMESQVASPLRDISQADQLITLAVDTRDSLKEYTDRIHTLEQIVSSQKQLLDNQRQSIKRQETIIVEQKDAIDRYEKQLEHVNRQYNDMNQTLLKLNSIQTELRMIGQED